jgi:uncharacterized protein YbjT (DUF2867 family)
MPFEQDNFRRDIGRDAMDGHSALVFGATGQQGGAVAAALRAKGWTVRALVRNSDGDKAQALATTGVIPMRGDFSDDRSIRDAMAGVHSVFSVQPSSGQGAAYGVSDAQEIRYGKRVADLAVETGVQHLVYSSIDVAGAENTGMGHFDSKLEIEAHIRSLDLRSTIVRPTGFMELMMLPGMGLDRDCFTFFLRPDQSIQTIAVQDIGKIVAAIFQQPDRYAGSTIEMAGDQVTGNDLQVSLSRAAGKAIRYHRFPDSLLEQNPFLAQLAALVDNGRLAGSADIAALKQEFGSLLNLDAWLDGPGKPLLLAALETTDAAVALR